MPVTTELPCSNSSKNPTYQEGYDPDRDIGPIYDSVANQTDDDDEAFDKE